MLAIVFESNGGPEVLEAKQVPDPQLEDGQVLVEVEAVGVNYRDVYEREGHGYGSPPPAIIGVEGAGRLARTGERVGWVGVAGSYAERVAARPEALVPIPDGVSSELAAAVLLQGMTAYYLATDSYPIQRDDWVIVHAAAGGVGLLLTQLAKLRGGHVIATTSSDEKAQLAEAAGADEVAEYENFAERALELTDGEGVAAVYDGVGRTTFLQGLEALRPTGRMILFGAASGQPEPLDVTRLTRASLYVQRPILGHYVRTPEMLRARAGELLDLVAEGRLEVRVGERYPLAEARRAHEELEARRSTGKLLLIP